MAELNHQALIADMRARGVPDDQIIATLRPKSETIIIQAEPSRRTDIRWIVGGVVVTMAMCISLFWSVFVQFLSVIEASAVRNHEVAMSALSVTKTASEKGGDSGFVLVLVAVAVVLIVLGLFKVAK